MVEDQGNGDCTFRDCPRFHNVAQVNQTVAVGIVPGLRLPDPSGSKHH